MRTADQPEKNKSNQGHHEAEVPEGNSKQVQTDETSEIHLCLEEVHQQVEQRNRIENQVTHQSRPLWFTTALFWSNTPRREDSCISATTSKILFTAAVIVVPLLYSFCLFICLKEEMYLLSPMKAADYLVQEQEATQKYFALMSLDQRMEAEGDPEVGRLVERMRAGEPIVTLGNISNFFSEDT